MSLITKAAIARDHNAPLIIEDVALRAPGRREVLVEMKASGLCHTDLSIVQGNFPFPLPAILGHEGAGIVRACGPDVTRVKEGDHVILNNLIHCGECEPCRKGKVTGCVLRSELDAMPFHWNGEPLRTLSGIASFARHTVIRQEQVTVIPQSIPFASAAVVPCGVMTGAGAVWNDAKVEPGSTVVVFGLGSIGLNVVQAAAISGASRIVAIDINPGKEQVARLFGATHFVNPRDLALPLKEHLTASLGGLADYAFECVGNVDLLAQAVDLVDPFSGVCLAVGVPPQNQSITLPASTFYLGRTVRGTHIGDGNPLEDTPRIVSDYQNGAFKLNELVTHTLPLDRINEGFDLMKTGQSIRAVILY
jgi:S-(hydroxymethyl)glutathione dehydrogenase/alcohol dehydrogenase